MDNTKSSDTKTKTKKTLGILNLLALKIANFTAWFLAALFFVFALTLFNSQGLLTTIVMIIGSIMMTPSFKRILTNRLNMRKISAIAMHLFITGVALGLVSMVSRYMYSEEKQISYKEQFESTVVDSRDAGTTKTKMDTKSDEAEDETE